MSEPQHSDHSDLSPPAKRLRIHPPAARATVLVRSEIWMPYGDIILQAESTLFRVNRDVLAKHSSMFQGMFLLPQPPNQETVDGCAIVELSDSAKDVGILLGALYNPFHHKFCQPFEVVACMLRLGRKYEITEFKDDALSRLHYEFPAKLGTWDRRLAKNKLVKITERRGIVIDLLNLVYENGVYTSIPALAFKCLENYTLEGLSNGIKRKDGTQITFPDSTKLTLALASERILRLQWESIQWLHKLFLLEDLSNCGDCQLQLLGMHDMYHLEHFQDMSCIIHPWDTIADADWMKDVCEECKDIVKAQWEIRRREAWGKLPSFFGLPGWKDLKDMD
ncbi:hypothetical protein DFH09DRAFT_1496253 [Mycena vulgaris]|nr:hypothetical protein DFH09DRAFT_1496253 [Mycena vulgaris]